VTAKKQRKQSHVDYLEAQLESHTSRGVPGTAALMQYNVIRGLRYESVEKRDMPAKTKLLTGIMLGWCLTNVMVVCTKQTIYVVTG
jgi:hypothetical protein